MERDQPEKPSVEQQALPQDRPVATDSLMDAVLEQELGIPIGTLARLPGA